MKRTQGFTLIELLVVIAIIGVLASIVLASINIAREDALKARAMGEMKSIRTAMEILRNDSGLYPHKQARHCPPRNDGGNEVSLASSTSGLAATDGTYDNWHGPYFSATTDPWGQRPYFLDEDYYCTAGALGCNGLVSTGSTTIVSALVSCGPDGMIGEDPDNGTPNNSPGCAYNDDNVVLLLCTS